MVRGPAFAASNHRLTHVFARQASLQDIPSQKIAKLYRELAQHIGAFCRQPRDVSVTTRQRDNASTMICVDNILRDSLVGGDAISDATTHRKVRVKITTYRFEDVDLLHRASENGPVLL
jgi:hypothetical protein